MNVADWLATAALATVLMTAGAWLITVLPTPEKASARLHFLLSFCASLALLAAYWNLSAASGRQGFAYADDQDYHLAGQSLAESRVALSSLWSAEDRNPGFVIWTAALYRVFGSNTIIVRVFNIFFHCLWVLPLAFLAALYDDPRTTRLAIGLGAWAPSAMLISLLHVKDVVAALAFLAAMAALAYMERSRAAVPVLAAAALLLWLVREDLLLLVAPLACIFAIRSLRGGRGRLGGITVLAAAALFAGVVVPALIDSWILGVAGSGLTSQIFAYTSLHADSAHGLAPLFIRGVGDLWKLPLSMTAVVVLPFPPDFSSGDIYPMANGCASLFVLALLPFAFAGCLTTMRRLPMKGLPIYSGFLGCAALLALVFPGTSRYREQLIGLFCLLAAAGITHWRAHRRLLTGVSFAIGCAFVVGAAMHL